MIVSIDWMRMNFRYFNQKYFEGFLPDPHFGISRSRTRLGSMTLAKTRLGGRIITHDFTIRVTTYYDMTEKQAQSIVLHEMIHYDIAYRGLQDTSAHGVLFRKKMKELNMLGNWGIDVTSSIKDWKVADWVKMRQKKHQLTAFVILVIHLTSDKLFISRANPKFVKSLERKLNSEPSVIAHEWYVSNLKEFEQYPQVRSLRGRQLAKAELQRLLPGMKALQFENK
ncbi:MAG: SprT-like domain-containing protein [Prevotella sp.]|jgi:hypothetical protein|nr:SprT-like domain-containing protein [Prevotella sp.]